MPESNQLICKADPMKGRHVFPTLGKALKPWIQLDQQDTGVGRLEAPKVVVLNVVLIGADGEDLVLWNLFMDSLSEHDRRVNVEREEVAAGGIRGQSDRVFDEALCAERVRRCSGALGFDPGGEDCEGEAHGLHQDEMADKGGVLAEGLAGEETHGSLVEADRAIEQGLVVAEPGTADEDAGEDVPGGQEPAYEHSHLWQGQRVHGLERSSERHEKRGMVMGRNDDEDRRGLRARLCAPHLAHFAHLLAMVARFRKRKNEYPLHPCNKTSRLESVFRAARRFRFSITAHNVILVRLDLLHLDPRPQIPPAPHSRTSGSHAPSERCSTLFDFVSRHSESCSRKDLRVSNGAIDRESAPL